MVLGLVLDSLDRVCPSRFEIVLFKAALLVDFFGAFQISELVSPSKRVLGGLLLGDVTCSDSSVRLWIQLSKTDHIVKRGPGGIVQGIQCTVLFGASGGTVSARAPTSGWRFVHSLGWLLFIQFPVYCGFTQMLISCRADSRGICGSFLSHRDGH